MKYLRNKFIIGLLCIAIGITAGFVLLPKAQNADISKVKVVRLTQNVKAGTKLEHEMLETITVDEASAPAGSAATIESFLSRYSVTQLFSGDILTTAKVRDTLVDPVAAAAAKGKQIVSVTVPSLSAGVSGTLLPGDVVSVMVTRKVTQFNQQLGLLTATEESTISTPDEEAADGTVGGTSEETTTGNALVSGIQRQSETIIPEELRYLEVCKVTSSDGTTALVNDVKDPEQANRLPATVSLYVTESQALKLAEIEQNGEIHITFLARGDDADVYIPRDQRVLVEEPIPEITPESAETAAPEVPVVTEMPTQPVTNDVTPTAAPYDDLLDNPEVGE